MTVNNAWVYYGDVSPFEHGGTWVRLEEGSDEIYEVIKVVECEDDGTAEVNHLTVDISDSWIDWEAVGSYADFNPNTSIEYKVTSAISYYGMHEFGCPASDDTFNNERDMRGYLSGQGITV